MATATPIETMITTAPSETAATTTPSKIIYIYMATTTNPPDPGDGTTITVNSIKTDATSEANGIASKTVGMITVDQSMATAPIGAIVGAIIGSVFLLLILGIAIAVIVLYLVRRRSTGVNYSTGRRAGEKKVMVECKPYACMHDITEQQRSTENWDSKLDMEQNVAYESSNTAQISLGTNIAYYESGRQLEENVYENDYQYDYI